MKPLKLIWILSAALAALWSSARADDVITNVMSPVVSYQYPNDMGSEALTNGGLLSPIASYQYFEWPGNDVLQLDSSPWVSYFYPFVGGTTSVSAAFSQVGVSPCLLPADGQSTATVTVTLLDGNGNPLSGKTVRISVVEQTGGGVATLSTLTQPAGATDGYGQATATLRSAVVGTAIISVQDVTDGVVLTRQPTVAFGSGLVVPGTDLANAIVQLANSSSNLLIHSVAGIATDEGGYGDWFQTQLTADKREQGVNELATGVGGVLSLLVPGSEELLRFFAVFGGIEVGPRTRSFGLSDLQATCFRASQNVTPSL